MNLVRLSIADLRARAASTLANLVLLSLGVATAVFIVLVSGQLEERVRRDVAGIDFVVTARAMTPTQGVLAALYQLDAPTATMPWAEAQRVSGHLGVRTGIPMVLRDNYWGYRIVGTTYDYVHLHGAKLRAGRLWERPTEAVLGAEAAARMHARVGTRFVATQGLGESRDAPPGGEYEVVGVLTRTGGVIDRLVLTDVAIGRSHAAAAAAADSLVHEPLPEEAGEVTAVLVQCLSPAHATAFAAAVRADPALQAIEPERELRRIFRFLGVGAEVLWSVALILLLAALVSVWVALYNSLGERRQDVAVMRVLGASPGKVMALLLLKGVLLAGAGAALGLVLGHLFTAAVGAVLTRAHQVSVTGWLFDPIELWVVLTALLLGVGAALIPAWRARHLDIGATLARS